MAHDESLASRFCEPASARGRDGRPSSGSISKVESNACSNGGQTGLRKASLGLMASVSLAAYLSLALLPTTAMTGINTTLDTLDWVEITCEFDNETWAAYKRAHADGRGWDFLENIKRKRDEDKQRHSHVQPPDVPTASALRLTARPSDNTPELVVQPDFPEKRPAASHRER